MRPAGLCAKALLQAAQRGPGDVVALAHRAQISVPVARYTASRLVARGDLSIVQAGRPAVLGLPEADAAPLAVAALESVLYGFADL